MKNDQSNKIILNKDTESNIAMAGVGDLTYSTITNSIKVSATPHFMEEESAKNEGQYFWAYQINIENLSKVQIQLLKRHWIIIEANGTIQEVHGDGVVGVQPTLNPSESFEYCSAAKLSTATGMMLGKYEILTQDGNLMEIDIPVFALDSPQSRNNLN